MASIERTAYPRFKRHLSTRELETLYTPTPQEIAFARETARGSAPTGTDPQAPGTRGTRGTRSVGSLSRLHVTTALVTAVPRGGLVGPSPISGSPVVVASSRHGTPLRGVRLTVPRSTVPLAAAV